LKVILSSSSVDGSACSTSNFSLRLSIFVSSCILDWPKSISLDLIQILRAYLSLLIFFSHIYMGEPIIHWFHVESTMEREEGSRIQCSLKKKWIGPRLRGSTRRRDIGWWSDPSQERMEDTGIRGEMRRGTLVISSNFRILNSK
jgi:hypothetical protein